MSAHMATTTRGTITHRPDSLESGRKQGRILLITGVVISAMSVISGPVLAATIGSGFAVTSTFFFVVGVACTLTGWKKYRDADILDRIFTANGGATAMVGCTTMPQLFYPPLVVYSTHSSPEQRSLCSRIPTVKSLTVAGEEHATQSTAGLAPPPSYEAATK